MQSIDHKRDVLLRIFLRVAHKLLTALSKGHFETLWHDCSLVGPHTLDEISVCDTELTLISEGISQTHLLNISLLYDKVFMHVL
jgi:hypothetical protein